MSFIPPFYTKFGKNVKDLHKKKYEFDHSVKAIHKTSDVTVETSAIQNNATHQFKGLTKFNFPRFSTRGTLEGELHTDEKSESKATFKFIKPYPGLNLAVNVHSATRVKLTPEQEAKVAAAKAAAAGEKKEEAKKEKKEFKFVDTSASFEADYVRENFSATLTGRSDTAQHQIDASAAVGMDGISLGGQLIVKAVALKPAEQDASQYHVGGFELNLEKNFGAEYSQPDFTSSLWTEKNSRYISFGYFQKLSSFHQLGATFKYDTTGKDARNFVAGTDYRLDANTTVRAKVDLPTGVVSTALEHHLPNPNLLLSIGTEYNAPKQHVQKFGVGLTFGDF